jgi:hypothetical protein
MPNDPKKTKSLLKYGAISQVECWFSILSRGALQGGSFTSVRMLVQAIDAFIASWNQNAAPFEWTTLMFPCIKRIPCLNV